MNIDFVKLGAYIRNARTQQGKTLEEMASQTGCSAEFLQNLEKGQRKQMCIRDRRGTGCP